MSTPYGPGEGGYWIQVPGNRVPGNRVPGNRARLAVGNDNMTTTRYTHAQMRPRAETRREGETTPTRAYVKIDEASSKSSHVI